MPPKEQMPVTKKSLHHQISKSSHQTIIFAAMTTEQIKDMRGRVVVLRRFL
jgi:hypothetical protein